MKRQRLSKRPKTEGKLFNKIFKHQALWLSLLLALHISTAFANGINVSNVSYSQVNGTVTFDLSWNNSWRNSATAANNWDAAWVFVKWRDCSAQPNIQFTHGTVSTTVSDHNFNVASGATTFQPTDRYGNAPAIDASPDNNGVMLRENNASSPDPFAGTVSATVTLKLNNLPGTGSLDLRVFAIEMVFIPQGGFSIGDGSGWVGPTTYNGGYASSMSFRDPFVVNTSNSNAVLYPSPASIASEDAQKVYEWPYTSGSSYNSSAWTCPSSAFNGSVNGICALAAGFPKGYNAYYIMKYEISQGQYADFLNAIFSLGQVVHYPNQSASGYRHTITGSGTPPAQYVASRPDRACNYLGWKDEAAYLQWAGLRPLTELEYEKACRGTSPAVTYEMAWGNDTMILGTTISGTENGTEVINSPAGANIQWYGGYSGGDAGQGPVRCGIFANSSNNSRKLTGASFYGVLDLTGNVQEFYVAANAGITNNPSATGLSLGTGILDPNSGNHNISNWPPYYCTGNSTCAQPYTFVIRRGWNWYASNSSTYYYTTCCTPTNYILGGNSSYRNLLSVSNRYQGVDPGFGQYYIITADPYSGGRGGR